MADKNRNNSTAGFSFAKEGLLWKKARGRSVTSVFYKPWALRWFCFHSSLLQYYKPAGISGDDVENGGEGVSIDNQLSLRGTVLVDPKTAVVGKEQDPNKPFAFYVSNCKNTEHGTYETIYLAASSEEDMAEWMFMLTGGKSKVLTGIGLKVPDFAPVELKRAISRHAPRVKDLYEVQDRLGSGGFSVVKKGVDRTTGKVYALKLIQNHVFQKNRERTEEECKVLASLDHPGIVKLNEVVRTQKFFVIVMELLEGGDMFDRLVQKKRYHENDAKVIAAHILDAIRYLHSNDIVHRDVKPENIIFDKRGDEARLKLTDFGFATMYDRKNKLTATCGTPEYVAPEVLEEKAYDASVDLWSCGVVFYILLCGFPPFYGDTEDVLFDRICRAKYQFVKPYWDLVSKDAKDLIKNLLELDPKKRFTAQQALEHPWFSGVVGDQCSVADNAVPVQESTDLGGALEELRRYNAFRKLKKGILAVIATNKMVCAYELLGDNVDVACAMERISDPR